MSVYQKCQNILGGMWGHSFRMSYFNIFLFWAPLDVWAPNSISAPNFESEGDHNKYFEICGLMWLEKDVQFRVWGWP